MIYNLAQLKGLPVIHTNRLILRQICVKDAADMYEYSSNPIVSRYLSWFPHESRQYTVRYLKYIQKEYRRGTFYDWGIVDKSSGKFIGTCGYTTIDPKNNKVQVGYVLNPLFWGRGIAPEALHAIIDFAFRQLYVERVEAVFIDGNEQSKRVMEKCNMSYEGTEHNSIFVKGEYKTIHKYAIIRGDYITK